MNTPAIVLRDVSKKFRELTLFENASMQVRSGSITGLQGPNGSGKSVLFKMIVGLNRPEVRESSSWNRRCRATGGTFRANVGIVIDRPAYIGGMTGLGNLVDLARIRRLITEGEAAAAMERVGLDPEAPQKVRDYSLGMKQKLSIAQAFMEGQRLLLLDEAFNGLDEPSVHRIRALLAELREEGRTILLTSHNQGDIDAVCDDVWRVEQQGLVPVS